MGTKPDPTTSVVEPTNDAATGGKPDSGPVEQYDPSVTGDPTGAGGYDPASMGGYDPSAMGDPAQILAMMGPFMVVFAIVGLAIAAFSIFCWWKIFSKAGYSGALSLIFLAGIIPLIGPFICLGLFIWFSFAEWPVQRQARGEAAAKA
jgi:hypothetical protein